MLKNWFIQRRYDKQKQQFAHSELADFYTPPDSSALAQQSIKATDFIVLDFETTGLNTKTDRVLSMGWTTISRGRVQLGQCQHHFVKHNHKIPDRTVAIHHITEQEAVNGVHITEIFPYLLQQMSDKVLVAHFADIEVGFMQQIAQKVYGTTLPLQTLDTLQIAYQSKYKNAVHIPPDALNLFTLREAYELPRYKAHNAMQDAVATAELLLVQAEEMGGVNTVKTGKLLS